MEEEVLEKYRKAGKVASEARERAVKMTSEGTPLLEIAEETEVFIRERGAEPAFPVNISIDDIAAHYTPSIGEETVLEGDELVNIDVGVHVDGYIGDTAATVDLSGERSGFLEAVEEALSAAIDILEPGLELGKIGKVIGEAIRERDLVPVRNLSGHGLDRYVQHSGDVIPNIETTSQTRLEEGDAIAIEPFATDGAGEVKNGKPGNIFRIENKKARGRTERKVLNEIDSRFRTLPFASRWIESIPESRVNTTLSKLSRNSNIHSYEILKEREGGLVSQKEHTVLVKEEMEVTTL